VCRVSWHACGERECRERGCENGARREERERVGVRREAGRPSPLCVCVCVSACMHVCVCVSVLCLCQVSWWACGERGREAGRREAGRYRCVPVRAVCVLWACVSVCLCRRSVCWSVIWVVVRLSCTQPPAHSTPRAARPGLGQGARWQVPLYTHAGPWSVHPLGFPGAS